MPWCFPSSHAHENISLIQESMLPLFNYLYLTIKTRWLRFQKLSLQGIFEIPFLLMLTRSSINIIVILFIRSIHHSIIFIYWHILIRCLISIFWCLFLEKIAFSYLMDSPWCRFFWISYRVCNNTTFTLFLFFEAYISI